MPKDPSKSEQATPKRIKDARSEGKVITSQDVSSMVSMAGAVAFMMYLVPASASSIGQQFDLLSRVDCTRNWSLSELHGAMLAATEMLGRLLAPLLIGSVVLGVVGRVAQTGPYFEVKALAWKLDSLNPATGVKQVMPSGENLMKLLLVMAKVSVIALLAWSSMRKDLAAMSQLPMLPLAEGMSWSFARAIALLLRVLGVFLAIAVVDYALKRRKYFDGLMMDRQEIKEETRSTEGDPHVRGRQRQRMREMSRMRLIAEIPYADVIVVNPTHVAVALRYESGGWAPKIVAKGLRKRALRIREMAKVAGVPIVHEPPTARALYRHGKVGHYIPDHLFAAVATILAQLEKSGLRDFSMASAQPATSVTGAI